MAARMAALQPRPVTHLGGGGGVNQLRSPVASFTACRPPGVVPSTSDTAKYAWSPSTADPNSRPPSALPFPARYCHSTAPCLSGSNPQPTPDFCPATMMSRPPVVARIGALPKSWSGPSSPAAGQLAEPAAQMTKMSFGVTCDVHLIAPVSRSNAMIASLVGCYGSVY